MGGGGRVDPGRAESKREGLESIINPAGSADSPSTRVPPSMCTHPQLSCLVIGGGEARCAEVQREEERGVPCRLGSGFC